MTSEVEISSTVLKKNKTTVPKDLVKEDVKLPDNDLGDSYTRDSPYKPQFPLATSTISSSSASLSTSLSATSLQPPQQHDSVTTASTLPRADSLVEKISSTDVTSSVATEGAVGGLKVSTKWQVDDDDTLGRNGSRRNSNERRSSKDRRSSSRDMCKTPEALKSIFKNPSARDVFRTPNPPTELPSALQEKDKKSEFSDDGDETSSSFVKRPSVEVNYDVKFQDVYDLHERLGQGRFGKVYRVTDKSNANLEFAAKVMRALKPKDHSSVRMEIDTMNTLRHPKLVQLIAAFSHGREITMVMDYVSGGELFERVVDEDFELTERICIKFIRQICEGVGYMHENQIIHLDLKPENILCVDKTGTGIKIIDFGLARKFDPNQSTKVLLGTPEFVSPEVINFDSIGFPTDMWSLGVICYILLSGLSPFAGDCDSETYSNITAVRWDFDDEAFDFITADAKDFIQQLLVKSMSQRFSVQQALSHKWLQDKPNRAKKEKYKRLNTKNLRRFIVRRKWQKTGNAVRALSRLQTLAKLTRSKQSSSSLLSTNNSDSSGNKSGFLQSLKAQLSRENDQRVESSSPLQAAKQPQEQSAAKQRTSICTRPRFMSKIRNVERPIGSTLTLQCTLIGRPMPDVTWMKNGDIIRASLNCKITSNKDGHQILQIKVMSAKDFGIYACVGNNIAGREQCSCRITIASSDTSTQCDDDDDDY